MYDRTRMPPLVSQNYGLSGGRTKADLNVHPTPLSGSIKKNLSRQITTYTIKKVISHCQNIDYLLFTQDLLDLYYKPDGRT